MAEVLTGPIGISVASLATALAYTIAFIQWKRRLPNRWSSLVSAAIVLLGGQLLAGRLRGFPWSLILALPALLVLLGLIAGKGSVAVYYTDHENETPPEATRRARARLGWLLTGVFLAGLAIVLVVP